jgi:Tfp pilus assembly protein PilO
LNYIDNKFDYISETKKKILIESAQVRSLTDTKKKIEELKFVNERISNVLISESNAVNFINLIEEIAAKSGLEAKISKVDFKDPESEDGLGILDLQFRIVGDWSSVTTFLNYLESLPYLININSIRFSLKCFECYKSSEEGNFLSSNQEETGFSFLKIEKSDFPSLISSLFNN